MEGCIVHLNHIVLLTQNNDILNMVYHLREESSDGDSLAFIDVVEGRTQTLHNGRQPGTSMFSHRPIEKTNTLRFAHSPYSIH